MTSELAAGDETLVNPTESDSSYTDGQDATDASSTPSAPIDGEGSSTILPQERNVDIAGSTSLSSNVSLLTLSSLLIRAEELYNRFPPLPPPSINDSTHDDDQSSHTEVEDEEKASPIASLNVSEILGRNSVMLTWREDSSQLFTDDEAEKIVLESLPDVVFDYDGSSDRAMSDDGEWDTKEVDAENERRRKHQQALRRRQLMTSVVGVSAAVLVGVTAIVLYSVDRSLSNANGGNGGGRTLADWHRMASWAGGLILDAGEQIVGAF